MCGKLKYFCIIAEIIMDLYRCNACLTAQLIDELDFNTSWVVEIMLLLWERWQDSETYALVWNYQSVAVPQFILIFSENRTHHF